MANENETNDFTEEKPKKQYHIFLKIVSVITAFFIWFIIIGFESPDYERSFSSVPVEIINVTDMERRGYSIILEKKIYIDVKLSGKKAYINKIRPADIYAYVDVKNVESSGDIELPISIRAMDNISVTEQSEFSAILYIDIKTSKSFNVSAEIKQHLTDAGIEIGELSVEPKTVNVSGPAGKIKEIAGARVELYLEKIETSMYAKEKIILVDKNGDEYTDSFIRMSENSAEVFIPVLTTKEIELTVDYKHGFYNSKNARVSVTPKTIKIRGAPEYLREINQVQLMVIDEKMIEASQIRKVEINLPAGVDNMSGSGTADVEIELLDMDVARKIIPAGKFKVIAPEGLQYYIREENLTVKLLGPVPNVYYAQENGITVSVDLSKITEKGSYAVTADVSANLDKSLLCVGEYILNVEIY